ncbi:MAG: nucleotidyl transferase AbiEii/AbiGii toxin family protein [Actinobacteria bacterium]|nr:nucleotidyl transferase AbiEii/AbiGii toxin family protein [Actinomycetota bacterium]
MSVKMIQDRLDRYNCRSTIEEEQALREITQEIALAALGRTDFFQKAVFQGGTCLRIFHGLNRFSEDLDFALQSPNSSFAIKPYLDALAKELAAYGYELEMDDRSKLDQTVRKAFLKDDLLGNLLRLSYRPATGPSRKLRIKLELDANPPAGGLFETKYLDFPFPSAVCVFDLPSLFAGKLHALLCREYLKGRDWYDFIWYTARKTPINYKLLTAALDQIGPWRALSPQVDRGWVVEHLRSHIMQTDWLQAREEVRRFVKPNELSSLEFWSQEFFLGQCDKIT